MPYYNTLTIYGASEEECDSWGNYYDFAAVPYSSCSALAVDFDNNYGYPDCDGSGCNGINVGYEVSAEFDTKLCVGDKLYCWDTNADTPSSGATSIFDDVHCCNDDEMAEAGFGGYLDPTTAQIAAGSVWVYCYDSLNDQSYYGAAWAIELDCSSGNEGKVLQIRDMVETDESGFAPSHNCLDDTTELLLALSDCGVAAASGSGSGSVSGTTSESGSTSGTVSGTTSESGSVSGTTSESGSVSGTASMSPYCPSYSNSYDNIFTHAVTVGWGSEPRQWVVDGIDPEPSPVGNTLFLGIDCIHYFDVSDDTNASGGGYSHVFRFSETVDGTWGGGSEYTTGVTRSGTPGDAGAYVKIHITSSTPNLYYYCGLHADNAGTIYINDNCTCPSVSGTASGSASPSVICNSSVGHGDPEMNVTVAGGKFLIDGTS